jgi:light-regulated signal transduction histidine kinase (bacteriophytochrome)
MVESLLIYSRVTTREITFEDIDLNEVIEHLKKLELADSIAATGGILSVPKILPSVHGGYSQIRQVLQNLIGNALKYHKKDTPPQIAIRAVRQGDMIRVGVQDNGIGIREIHYDNIFVMFRRVDAKPEYKGSGIGLSVCKKIIERHNGKIGVVSTYGQGSTFWFTVPAAKTADVQQVQSEQVTTSHSL